jgi:hypothetical protein
MSNTTKVRPVRIGAVISGYCGGAFGRDGLGNKRIEALGADWVVVRYDDGRVGTAIFGSESELAGWVNEKGWDE